MHLISKILAVSIAACWISPALSAPTGAKQLFMNCTIKPKDTDLGTSGGFKRAMVSVNTATLNQVLLFTSLSGADQQRQRYFFIYDGQLTSGGTTKNKWIISPQYGNTCLAKTTGALVKAFTSCTTGDYWFLKALGDGTYLISWDFSHNDSWKLTGNADTNNSSFGTAVPNLANPGNAFRMEIRDCKDLNGNLVSVAP